MRRTTAKLYIEGRRLARAGLCQLADVKLLALAEKHGVSEQTLGKLATAVEHCYAGRAQRRRRPT